MTGVSHPPAGAGALLGGAGMVVLAGLLLTLPLWSSPGIVFLVGLTVVEALFSLSWNLLFGFAGLATFGHAAFFAMGAYLVGFVLKTDPSAPFLLVLAASAALGGASAGLVGLIALHRTGGVQLAILTLAISEVLHIVIGYSTALGREDGLAAIPRPALDLGLVRFDLADTNAYYVFLVVACLLLTAVLWWVTHSRFGRVLLCIRQDAARTAFIGVNVARYRLVAFILSGAVAALAGGIEAPWTQIVTPDTAGWVHSTQPILNALLGGASSFWGPVLGAAVFSVIGYGTRTLAGLSEIVVGLVLLVVVLIAPDGLLGLAAKLRHRLAARARTRPVVLPKARQ